jgi:hypothetical protein
MRKLIWTLYADLKVYRVNPGNTRHMERDRALYNAHHLLADLHPTRRSAAQVPELRDYPLVEGVGFEPT